MSEKRLISVEEALIEAIDMQLQGTSLGLLRYLEAEAERRELRCSYKQRRTSYCHAVDPHDTSHDLGVRSLPNIVRVTGSAAFVDVLLGLEQRVQRERRAINSEREGPNVWPSRG